MKRSTITRLSLVVILLLLLVVRVCNAQVIDLSTPEDPFTAAILEGIRTGKPPSRIDGCAVSEKSAQVHYQNGEGNYEESLIDRVNDDNTIQVTTLDTKLSLLFTVRSESIKCFRPGSIALVTIARCEKNEGQCDFTLPHKVYVRTEPAEILNWKYPKSARLAP